MLSRFRTLVSGVGAWILVALIVVVFAFVGVPALNNASQGNAVTVGDTRFALNAVEREFTRRIQQTAIEEGQALTREAALGRGFLDEALRYYTFRGVVEEEANALGIVATDDMLQTYLRGLEPFQDPETGEFDPAIFDRIVRANDMSMKEFRERIRVELLQRQMDEALGLPVSPPDLLADLILLRQTEERDVQTVVITAKDGPAPDEAALLSYYEANSGRYQTPDRRALTVLTLTPESLGDRVSVSAEDVSALFEARSSQLGTPATRAFTTARLSDAADASKIIDAIAGGASFEDAATSVGAAVATVAATPIGGIADRALREPLFAAGEGDLVGPIDGAFGPVLAYVSGATAGTTPTLTEEIRATLEAELKAEIFAEEIDILYDDIQTAGDSGASLEQVADDLGLSAIVTPPLSRSGIAADGTAPEGLPDAALLTAFQMAADNLFEEVNLPAGQGVAFVEVTAIEAATTLAFTEVADRVAADYRREERTTQLNAQADAIRLAIAGGRPFADVAAEYGVDPVARTVLLTAPAEGVPQQLLQAIFTAAPGETVTALTADGSGLAVGVVDAVRFGPNGQAAILKPRVKNQLAQGSGAEHYNAYLSALQEEFGVEVNRADLLSRLGVEQ